MEDNIDSLPSFKLQPREEELRILNEAFSAEQDDDSTFTVKLLVIAGVLFAVLSLPMWDNMILSTGGILGKSYSPLIVKLVVFTFLLWLALKKIKQDE